ncbi:LpqB family beta-propeller domain-containing protein [Candidatus Chloroploca mongolica]|nr:LpqB family beta-propeller domain-containing protein [Candidatus Chloroploca mongolica]
MNARRFPQRMMALLTAPLIIVLLFTVVPARAAPFDGGRTRFADPRFEQVWTRTDSEAVRSGRTWYWGPGPWFDYAEFYRQGANGLRTVQYFDKARMELNNPSDFGGPAQGVTNGLLVKELVSGRLQRGDDPYDVDMRGPSDVPAAGNPRNANPTSPGYGSFAGVATIDNGYRDPQRIGERISLTIDRAGNLGQRPDLALPETEIVQYNSVTGHNIPRIFWDFMGQQGPIVIDGRIVRGPVVDWLFAMGLPITDAYWTRARIGNAEQDVLVQLFERRVLTYVPSNPAGYKVEMGNVGQHYFQWRYPHLGTPWISPEPREILVYASNVDTGSHWEVYRYDGNGQSQRITFNDHETVAFSWRRSWDPGQQSLLGDSRRAGTGFRQLYEFDIVTVYDGDRAWNARVKRLSYSDGNGWPDPGPFPGYLPNNTANDYNAAASPDGTKLVFVSDRMGNGSQELMIAPSNGNNPVQLTSDGCVNESPSWSPDGRRIYWTANCDGSFNLYQAELSYGHDAQDYIYARFVNARRLTDNGTDNRYVRLAPDGRTLAYSIKQEGRWQLALYELATGRTRVFAEPGNNEAPTWSADSRTLAFASDRTGNYEIYTIGVDGQNLARLTANGAQNRWPLWAQ